MFRVANLPKYAAWSMIAAIVFVTVCPIGLRPSTETTMNTDRSLAFALLGFTFACAYPRRWKLVLLLLPLSAFSIEMMQFLSATRHPQLADATFKAIGTIVGVLLGRLAYCRLGGRPSGAELPNRLPYRRPLKRTGGIPRRLALRRLMPP